MIQFGVLIKNITFSQPGTQILHSLNDITKNNNDISPVIFYETYSKLTTQTGFAMIQHREAWLFNGPIIATCLDTVRILLSCPKPSPKFLYMWDLHWLYFKQYPMSQLHDIYMNDNLQLIARSKSHARILTNCWKKPVATIEDFNHHDITKLIRQTGEKLPEPIV